MQKKVENIVITSKFEW